MSTLPDLAPAAPEIALCVLAMALMMLGVFRKTDATVLVGTLSIAGLVAAMLWVSGMDSRPVLTFGGLFIQDGFAVFAKVLILVAAALAMLLALPWLKAEGIARFEYPILMLFSAVGMMLMVSAYDLMTLYVGLELQSLCLYLLAAYNRDDARSTEAGLKYFVLGALASGLLLYGASMLYGFTGTTNFAAMPVAVAESGMSVGVVVGLVFVLAGMAFKISAVPFHMWTPDVYQGAPTPVTAFFSVAPKVAAFALLIRLLAGPFGDAVEAWRQVLTLIALLSMVLGAVAAIAQTNLKRLMAYSSIGHVGYALVGVTAASVDGVKGVLIYLGIYLVMNVGVFALILSMRDERRSMDDISDLSGLSSTHPARALALALLMFSMAGVPPLAGFFGKFFVFMAAIEAGLITLAIVGVLSSVVAAFYYLRIIKVMYFDAPVEPFAPMDRSTGLVLGVCTVAVGVFILVTGPLLVGAEAAALAVFGG